MRARMRWCMSACKHGSKPSQTAGATLQTWQRHLCAPRSCHCKHAASAPDPTSSARSSKLMADTAAVLSASHPDAHVCSARTSGWLRSAAPELRMVDVQGLFYSCSGLAHLRAPEKWHSCCATGLCPGSTHPKALDVELHALLESQQFPGELGQPAELHMPPLQRHCDVAPIRSCHACSALLW